MTKFNFKIILLILVVFYTFTYSAISQESNQDKNIGIALGIEDEKILTNAQTITQMKSDLEKIKKNQIESTYVKKVIDEYFNALSWSYKPTSWIIAIVGGLFGLINIFILAFGAYNIKNFKEDSKELRDNVFTIIKHSEDKIHFFLASADKSVSMMNNARSEVMKNINLLRQEIGSSISSIENRANNIEIRSNKILELSENQIEQFSSEKDTIIQNLVSQGEQLEEKQKSLLENITTRNEAVCDAMIYITDKFSSLRISDLEMQKYLLLIGNRIQLNSSNEEKQIQSINSIAYLGDNNDLKLLEEIRDNAKLEVEIRIAATNAVNTLNRRLRER